jgi:membrane associated rhomboid family serine protease
MIPLGDSLDRRRRPWVTLGVIVVCVLVVLAALGGDPRVPRTELLTLFSSQFLHAGFLHLGGNMLFLWVFGRAVEDRIGSALYLFFYLIAGALAGLAQCLLSAGESVPLIGASGAIAGVLGAYFISYPTAWVRVLVPILFFFWTFDLPAIVVLAFWFVSQFFSGVTAITEASRATAGEVAVWAHVAGFVIGAASAPFLPRGSSGPGAAPGATGALRRADAPGPARLVSSVADLAALVLAARLVLRFFDLLAGRSPLSFVTVPILSVTEPVVGPLREVVPDLRVLGGVVETGTLAAILVVYLAAGLVGQLFLRGNVPAPKRNVPAGRR